MSWLTVDEFKSRTGISGTGPSSDSNIELSLAFAQKDIITKIFVSRADTSATMSTNHVMVHGFLMGKEGGTSVTTSDVDVYEVQTVEGIDYRYDLNHLKDDVVIKEKRLVTSTSIPTISDRTVYMEYKTGREWFSDMLVQLQELLVIVTRRNILTKRGPQKLQDGILDWTLNGVTISYNSNAVRDIIEDDRKNSISLMNTMRPRRFTGVRLGNKTKYPGLRRGGRVVIL